MAQWYDTLDNTEKILLRIAPPLIILFILLIFNFVYTESTTTQIRSLKAFFDITENTEYTSSLLILLWVYIVIVPVLFSFIIPKDELDISDATNTIIIKNADNFISTINLDTGRNTSFDFMKKLRTAIEPTKVAPSYDTVKQIFVFESSTKFSILQNSTIGKVIGFNPINASSFLQMNN